MGWILDLAIGVAWGLGVLALIGLIVWLAWKQRGQRTLAGRLRAHFAPATASQIAVKQRYFPQHIRADLQQAVEEFLHGARLCWFTGVRSEYGFGNVEFASLLDQNQLKLTGVAAAPPQYEQIDVGDPQPIETLMNGLWLAERGGTKFAVLCAPHTDFSGCGISRRAVVQFAAVDKHSQRFTAAGSAEDISRQFFEHLEREVVAARSYRGKILSFEENESYSGQSSGIKVHRLTGVPRDEVILPQRTLELLDRNVLHFVQSRRRLADLRMAVKKGLLFYGPPGTGKTHTIRYLAHALPEHTTLLISAEQVGLLGEYMTLARLLQPSLVVIEDADLIARERTSMHHSGTELLLNKLLNEMDGLREDCEVLFILTTNRPEELEGALASRPGRIDQAIEFPLPDAVGREKLIRLYARSLALDDQVVAHVVARTERVSASFIKELMRRSAQLHLADDGATTLQLPTVEKALEEMLFTGGSLNLKLLGAQRHIDEQDLSA
jgi:cell division protease FtsH